MAFFSVPRYAQEIDTMTVGDLEGVVFTKFEDPENVTFERLMRLSELARERNNDHTVDAAELRDRLWRVHESTHAAVKDPDLISPPCTPGPEECTQATRAEAIENFEILLKEGARPPKALQLDPGPHDPTRSDEKLHPLAHFTYEAYIFQQAIERWREFRKWQKAWRKTPEHFIRLKEHINEWRQERGFLDELILLIRPEHQTKLNEWKEYHGYQHSRVQKWERRLKAAQKAFDLAREKLAAGIPCRDEFWARESQVAHAKRKYEEAGPVLEWVERELPIVAAESDLKGQEQSRCSSNKNPSSPESPTFHDPKLAFESVKYPSSPPQAPRSNSSRTASEIHDGTESGHRTIPQSPVADSVQKHRINTLKRKRSLQSETSAPDVSDCEIERNMKRRKLLENGIVQKELNANAVENLGEPGSAVDAKEDLSQKSMHSLQGGKQKRKWGLYNDHSLTSEPRRSEDKSAPKRRRHSMTLNASAKEMCGTVDYSASVPAENTPFDDKPMLRDNATRSHSLPPANKADTPFTTSNYYLERSFGQEGQRVRDSFPASPTDSPDSPRIMKANGFKTSKDEEHYCQDPILHNKVLPHKTDIPPLLEGDTSSPSHPTPGVHDETKRLIPEADRMVQHAASMVSGPGSSAVPKMDSAREDTMSSVNSVIKNEQRSKAVETVAVKSLKRKAASEAQDPSLPKGTSGLKSAATKRRKILPRPTIAENDKSIRFSRSKSCVPRKTGTRDTRLSRSFAGMT